MPVSFIAVLFLYEKILIILLIFNANCLRHRRLLVKPQQPQQRQLPQQQQQSRSRLSCSDEHRDTICFYQDQSSIPLQHHPGQPYYQRCHHNQPQGDMAECRCCSQRETAALLANSNQPQRVEEVKNPSTPMVIRDAVKATHCQSKETVLEDLDLFGSQKSSHSAYQYHQLMLISGRQKNPSESLLKPKKHTVDGDLQLMQTQSQVPCSEYLRSLANSSFNYQ